MHLLFDVDGTLTDSREGIVRCIHYAILELGADAPPVESLTQYVGPPLPASFATLLGTSDPKRVDLALAAYRRRFERLGMFENALYPGIAEALEQFAAAGFGLHVVTAKPRVYARQILDHFNLSSRLRVVHGPELDQRDYSKASLVREACVEAHIGSHDGTVIGDRAEDMLAAKRNGLCSVAALWGYGGREELEAARPDCLASSIADLARFLNVKVART